MNADDFAEMFFGGLFLFALIWILIGLRRRS